MMPLPTPPPCRQSSVLGLDPDPVGSVSVSPLLDLDPDPGTLKLMTIKGFEKYNLFFSNFY